MYNRYFESDRDAFSDMFRAVEYDEQTEPESPPPARCGEAAKRRERFDLKRLFRGLDIDNMGIVPIILLLVLLLDVDDEERLIITALVMIFGI